MPNTATKPSAMISDGTHSGTAESERIKRFPGKLLFAVKKAAGMPIAAAVSVEKNAMARVRSAVRAIYPPAMRVLSVFTKSGEKAAARGTAKAPIIKMKSTEANTHTPYSTLPVRLLVICRAIR